MACLLWRQAVTDEFQCRRFLAQGGTGVCRVQFSVRADVGVGFALRIAGNHSTMGSWNVTNAVPLAYHNGRWVANLQLPCGRVYEYKYVVVKADTGALVSWQPGADSVLSIFREDTLLQVEGAFPGGYCDDPSFVYGLKRRKNAAWHFH